MDWSYYSGKNKFTTNKLRRLIYSILPVVLCLLAASCETEEPIVVIPEDVLKKEQMASVIIDIHMTEAKVNVATLPGATTDSLFPGAAEIDALYAKHNISPEQYDRSMQFYTEHPKLLNEIYDEVMQELSKMQAGQEQSEKQGQ